MNKNKIGLLFPGQGSQYVGMGEELYENFSSARKVLDEAKDILAFDLPELCFRGPSEALNQTENAQVAVLALSVACLRALEEKFFPGKLQFAAVAGHSLGEYTALVGAGSLEFASALKLVRKRGEFMAAGARNNPGGMIAVIGLEPEKIKELCQKDVQIANLNCPGQVVCSGTNSALEFLEIEAKQAGARKVIRLPVSGPFHSPLMKEAAEKLAEEGKGLNIQAPQIPFFPNTGGAALSEPAQIWESLVKQLNSPVYWEQSIRRMLKMEIKTFLEVGPGKVLTGLMRRIDKTALVYNIEDKQSLAKAQEAII